MTDTMTISFDAGDRFTFAELHFAWEAEQHQAKELQLTKGYSLGRVDTTLPYSDHHPGKSTVHGVPKGLSDYLRKQSFPFELE